LEYPTNFSESAEAAIVQLFAEVKRHKPSVIYLPGIDTWYATLAENVISTFLGMLQAIPPTDPVLVLGITDRPLNQLDKKMVTDLFGFSRKNCYTIQRPARVGFLSYIPVFSR
jgi:SpoVK/Ycf46/Vps4 family AAA+-type ATPase